jgi:hypothetical protein
MFAQWYFVAGSDIHTNTYKYIHTHIQVPINWEKRSGTHIENVTFWHPMMIFCTQTKTYAEAWFKLITKKKLYGKAYTRTSSQKCFNLIKFSEHHHKKQQKIFCICVCTHTHTKTCTTRITIFAYTQWCRGLIRSFFFKTLRSGDVAGLKSGFPPGCPWNPIS